MEFFEGNFTEYEEYKKRTLGADALEPHRIKYKKIAKYPVRRMRRLFIPAPARARSRQTPGAAAPHR